MHAGDLPTNIDAWMRRVEATQRDLDSRLRNASPGLAARSASTTTDGSGLGSFLFGRTYAAPPVVVALAGIDLNVSLYLVTTTGFTVKFSNQVGTTITGAPVTLQWLALPATT